MSISYKKHSCSIPVGITLPQHLCIPDQLFSGLDKLTLYLIIGIRYWYSVLWWEIDVNIFINQLVLSWLLGERGFRISEAKGIIWCPIYTLGGNNLRVMLKVSQEENQKASVWCASPILDYCSIFISTRIVWMWGAYNENGPNIMCWANRRSTLADLNDNERAPRTRWHPDASGGLLVPGLGSRGQAKLLVHPGPGRVWSWRGGTWGCFELPPLVQSGKYGF